MIKDTFITNFLHFEDLQLDGCLSHFRCPPLSSPIGCHPVQVIMNRPIRIYTAYPGLLELDHSHSLQDLFPLLKENASSVKRGYDTWWTVPSISTGTMKSALLMGCERKQCMRVIQADGAVPLVGSSALNTKSQICGGQSRMSLFLSFILQQPLW